MSNVSHSTLTGSNLHENKGVAAATDNTVATATSGATVWQKLTASHLTGTGNPFGAQLLHVNCSAQTISGWTVLSITQVTNEISSASVAANQITLPAGTYWVDGLSYGPAAGGGYYTALHNYTDNTDTLVGSGMTGATNLGYSGPSHAVSRVVGRFTIASQKVFEFKGASSATGSNAGYGNPTSSAGCLMIWKIA